jgi:hypothetical protein
MYMLGAVTVGIFGFIYFGLLNSGSTALIFIAVFLSLVPHDMMYGPQAALIAESFTGRLRYSGASLGYGIGSVVAGGFAPLVAAAIVGATGSFWLVVVFLGVLSVLTTIAALAGRETAHEPLAS